MQAFPRQTPQKLFEAILKRLHKWRKRRGKYGSSAGKNRELYYSKSIAQKARKFRGATSLTISMLKHSLNNNYRKHFRFNFESQQLQETFRGSKQHGNHKAQEEEKKIRKADISIQWENKSSVDFASFIIALRFVAAHQKKVGLNRPEI